MRYGSSKRWVRSSIIAFVLATVACRPASPIRWEAVRTLESGTFDSVIPSPGSDSSDALFGLTRLPGPICEGSARVALDWQGGQFAAWWAPRADSNAILVVARRAVADSGEWTAPVVADARDRGRAGCRRPAPGISADGARGYVHLAYYLDAPTGAGVYGGHSMESGAYFHDPVAIVYGDRPVAAEIATSGDIAAVAYEDPNSARSRIAVAISLTAGHLYEHRVDASPSTMRATSPWVMLTDRRIAVAWSAAEWERGAEGSRAMMRVGTIVGDARPGSGGHER